MNGFDLLMNIDEAEAMVQATARGELDVPALSQILLNSVKRS
jgi:hypothetical protein